jgi:aerobic-type carbon monoxide dehydrogenase small subunit (CoxS/CutS family)
MSRISCTINGTRQTVTTKPGESLREMLVRLGHFAVRDSDNGKALSEAIRCSSTMSPPTPI